MSWTERHISNNVLPMFRRQTTTAKAAERPNITREAFALIWQLRDLADLANAEDLKDIAHCVRQAANDIDYKARQLDMAERLPPADAYNPEEYSENPSADEWVVDITDPSTLRDAA